MKNEKKIAYELSEADMAFEGENLHDRVGLPQALFDAIKPLVQNSDHVKLARKIRKALTP